MKLDGLDFEKGQGRITVVAQDANTGRVLMVAAADPVAVERTLHSGEMHYTSRTRGLWHKGGTSGNVQRVVHLERDCDGDALLAQVVPAGPACHEGTTSCFRDWKAPVVEQRPGQVSSPDPTVAAPRGTFAELDATIVARAASAPAGSYTHRLLNDRNHRLKKLGEEAAELVLACADEDRGRIAEEAADLVYHLLVAARAAGVSLKDIEAVLARRASPQASSSSGAK